VTRNTTPPKPVGVPPTPGGSVPATVLTPSQGPVDPPARLLALHGAEQTYAWGSRTAIPDLLGRPPADGPVAVECETVLRAYGFEPERLDDVGVAGLHRILDHADDLATADAVVVAAGMEGALASVVGGLTAAPVVAVPTSAGYGTSLGGFTALLSMLSSCSQGVTVVGIDNGFGAACAVTRLCNRRARRA